MNAVYGLTAIVLVCLVTLGVGGPEAVAHDQRLLRRGTGRHAVSQRQCHRGRVPLCRKLPRHRGSGVLQRFRHAVVPRGLHRRLRRAARARRRPAAPLRCLHPPRLRRGAAGEHPDPPALLRARRRHRLAVPPPPARGAGLALRVVTGAPTWVGSLVVVVVVIANVAAGGMRSITLVQAMQYWLKLTAIAIPAFVLLGVWLADATPAPEIAGGMNAPGGSRSAGSASGPPGLRPPAPCSRSPSAPWACRMLVRFYTNPDGRAARRTT